MDDPIEVGRGVVQEMYGHNVMEDIAQTLAPSFANDITRIALSYCYGEIWGRPGLDMRARSLVTIGTLVAQRHQNNLAAHVRGGLGNGLTPDEIREAILHTLPYVGFPAMVTAMGVVEKVLEELAPARNPSTG